MSSLPTTPFPYIFANSILFCFLKMKRGRKWKNISRFTPNLLGFFCRQPKTAKTFSAPPPFTSFFKAKLTLTLMTGGGHF